eukprot:227615-Pelagomonas_calceolata.AAC.2
MRGMMGPVPVPPGQLWEARVRERSVPGYSATTLPSCERMRVWGAVSPAAAGRSSTEASGEGPPRSRAGRSGARLGNTCRWLQNKKAEAVT